MAIRRAVLAEADVEALLPLAAKHAAELDGTEITPKRIAEIAELLVHFRAVRAGVRVTTAENADGEATTTTQKLSARALKAQRARNAAFWALSALDRLVCSRGRFAFRRDAKLKALFTAYTEDRVGSGKTAAPRVKAPKAPTDKAPDAVVGTSTTTQQAAPDGAPVRTPR